MAVNKNLESVPKTEHQWRTMHADTDNVVSLQFQTLEALDREFSAVFRRENAIYRLHDIVCSAFIADQSVVTIEHWNASTPTQKFQVRRFVYVLKATPAAHIVHKDGFEWGSTGQNVSHEADEILSLPKCEPTLPDITISPNNYHAMPVSKILNYCLLELYRAKLLIC